MHRRADQPGVKIGAARRKAAFVFIFATILLDMLAMGIVIPVLPKLVVDFVGGDTREAAKIFGLFGAAWALMQFLFAPLQGSLSDSFGRRPVILISNFGVGLDYVLMALAPTLGWLFAGRVLSGIASSSIATAYAYVADVTPADRRAARFGLLGAAFGAGFVLGPALGGWAGSISPLFVDDALSKSRSRAANSCCSFSGTLNLLRTSPKIFSDRSQSALVMPAPACAVFMSRPV